MYWTQGLHRSLQQTPDHPATIFGARVRTYREQADRVARLAAALRELGVRDGERVAILARNSDRFAELLLAVPWANGVLNPVSLRWTPTEIVHALRETQTDILFVDDQFAPTVPALRDRHPGLRAVVRMEGSAPGILGFEELIAGSEPVEDARRGGDALAAVYYTAGTSGATKGVMLSHAGLLETALAVRATVPSIMAPGGRVLLAAPMGHLSGCLGWLLQSILGGTHVIVPAFAPAAVLGAIQRHRVSHLFLVPAMLQQVVDHPAAGEHDLSSLQAVTYGASPITEALLERAMKTFPAASFMQVYAMTELAGAGTFLTPEDHRDGTRLRSAGRPIVNTEVRVVDTLDAEVPRGTVGEVVCRTDGVMLGYWGRPGETAQALRGGWMHTGDAGWMDDDGYLYIVDRLKDMIITEGYNVASVEVENALGTHPAVAACAVIGVPDDRTGERVHAVVVNKPGQNVTAAELATHCRARMAAYKVPASVQFVEALPLSPQGKVLKRELRKPFWEGMDRQVH
jgi:acyl-CoA synthetase (AMP-forming)/AMP-acid ligase II